MFEVRYEVKNDKFKVLVFPTKVQALTWIKDHFWKYDEEGNLVWNLFTSF